MSVPMGTTLYYFSGTGNSLWTVQQLTERLEDVVVTPMAQVLRQGGPPLSTDVVGLVHPLFYYGLPRIVSDFVSAADLQKAEYVFSVVACSAPHGSPFRQTQKLLAKQGKRLDAAFYLPLPVNLSRSSDSRGRRKKAAPGKLDLIADTIKARGRKWDKERSWRDYLYATPTLSKRFQRSVHHHDERFSVTNDCTSCGICERMCPVANIKMVNDRPTWTHRCEQCMACIYYCPEEAISHRSPLYSPRRFKKPQPMPMKEMLKQRSG
jgi:formate hydrogenlyase subunit 6/NADH:ubiquinone oxidoreductase subunit I